MDAPNGRVGHAEMKIGDSIFMLADECPEWGAKSAITAGGVEVRPVKDQFYGDRSGTLRDPFGYQWTISTHTEDLSPQELGRRAQEALKQQPGAEKPAGAPA